MHWLFSNKRLLSYSQRVNRLRCFTGLFFILLFVPVTTVFYISFKQFENDLLTQYQRQAELFTDKLNKRIFKRVALANALPSDEFDYYQTLYNPVNQQVTQALSPLTKLETFERFPGHIGFYQIDQQGQFNSPVWPEPITPDADVTIGQQQLSPELIKRQQIVQRLHQVTSSSEKMQELIGQTTPGEHKKFHLINDTPDYYIFYRAVKSVDQTKLQGYVLHRESYINSLIKQVLETTPFESPITLRLHSAQPNAQALNFFTHINQQGKIEVTQSQHIDDKLSQITISNQAVNWPYMGYTLAFSTTSLQLTSTAIYTIGLMLILLSAMVIGCIGFYRIGVKQLTLAEQRLNFVSSVSHELKTPLTSIRMYAEMLKTGQVLSSQHQSDYYEFIFSESERLSRLIDNILQLSKLSQPQHSVHPQHTKLSVLIDIIRSKVSSILVKNDFNLCIEHGFTHPDNVMLLVDIDAFSQVVINITDNAVKFFDREKIQDQDRQKIDFIFQIDPQQAGQIQLKIRDYGSGISPEQENKLFDLFYRGGSELTRSTQGTGIGLALVNELVLAQHGSIKVQRMTPGLAINMSFKCTQSPTPSV
ncbi:hypothetical protein CW748_05180 [Alteromonadales bacterium alter-6D02]|nr:hypothetical protein CW748_05180 [Alteromonadales bacterium alter-6D02]